MSIGYHGKWCNTRTWPTKCPNCKQQVFFFSCACGSKVFFESLGQPWPEHRCLGAVDQVDDLSRLLIEFSAHSADAVAQRWRGCIDERYEAKLLSKQRDTRDPIVAVAPRRGLARNLVGVLREIAHPKSVFGALGLPDSPMTRAMLGPLARGQWVRITVHVRPDDDDQIESYTGWAQHSQKLFRVMEPGMTVSITLRMLAIATQHAWLCEDLVLCVPGSGQEGTSHG